MSEVEGGDYELAKALKAGTKDVAVPAVKDMGETLGKVSDSVADGLEGVARDTAGVENDTTQSIRDILDKRENIPSESGGSDRLNQLKRMLNGEDQSRTWDDVAQRMPTDSTGRQMTPAEAEHLGISPDQIQWLHDRDAPLGQTPEQFQEFRSSLFGALREDGVADADVDVRLQGSSAKGFSGPHKDFLPRPGSEAREYLDSPEGQSKLADWPAGPENYPANRPFDAGSKLGFDEPSDYDVQISSDAMLRKAAEVHEAAGRSPDTLINPKYGFLNKETARETFPALGEWARRWEQNLGREVNPAVFQSSGPPDNSPGISAHFQDSDWIIRPGDSK